MISSLLVALAQGNNSVMDVATTIYCNPAGSGYTLLLAEQLSGSKSLYGQLDPGSCQDSVSDGSYGSYYICDYLGNDTLVDGFCKIVLGGTDVDVISTDQINAYGWSNYGQWGDTKSIACHFQNDIDCWWHWQIKAGDTIPECEKSASCEDWQGDFWSTTNGALALGAIAVGGCIVLAGCAVRCMTDPDRQDNPLSGLADCCFHTLKKLLCCPFEATISCATRVSQCCGTLFGGKNTTAQEPLIRERESEMSSVHSSRNPSIVATT